MAIDQIVTASIADSAVATVDIANNAVTQAKVSSGVSGTGPAFRAVTTGNTGCAQNTYTKLQFNSEIFDTNNCYDTSTFRFTPTVAGYYQVNGYIEFPSYNASYVQASIFKNGVTYSRFGAPYSSSTGIVSFLTSDLVYMNGTTDYIELYSVQGSAGTQNASNGLFSASMVRAA